MADVPAAVRRLQLFASHAESYTPVLQLIGFVDVDTGRDQAVRFSILSSFIVIAAESGEALTASMATSSLCTETFLRVSCTKG